MLLVYLFGVVAGAWLTLRAVQFTSAMAPDYARIVTWAMVGGTLFWPALPVAVPVLALGIRVLVGRRTPN